MMINSVFLVTYFSFTVSGGKLLQTRWAVPQIVLFSLTAIK